MSALQTIEDSRVRAQQELDAAKTHAERNKLGQFATPPELALQIMKESKEFVGKRRRVRFLDPAFGTGAFYSALLQILPENQIESASGFEIDPHYGAEAGRLWAHSPLRLVISDFFSIRGPVSDDERANLIVCNPPYVRHHHLSGSQKERMSGLIAKTAGMKINGLSGLYCYFLVYSDSWLADGGIGCWLIPSEFMDVNYGLAVKEYLLNRVTLLRIHRFDPSESQFEDALVSSAVVWFRKSPPPSGHVVSMTFGGTVEAPRMIRQISVAELLRTHKWTGLTSEYRSSHKARLRISDIFAVKRGLATGDNEFFILTPEEIKQHRLPRKFLIPILPSPRFLTQDVVDADEKGDPEIERRQYLLSCTVSPEELKKSHPSVWEYMESGVARKVHERYLCDHRSPWYAQENRPAAPFLCTYMGRHDSPTVNPFRFILNYSKATAANVYLLLYPKPPLARLLQEHPSTMRKVWEALGNISPNSLIAEGRVYGGGLHKVEPKELGNAPADEILKVLPELGPDLQSLRAPTLFETSEKC